MYKILAISLVLATTVLGANATSFLEEDKSNVEAGEQGGYNTAIVFGERSNCLKFEDYDFWEDMYPVWKNTSLWTIPQDNILGMDPAHISHHLTTKPILKNIIKNPMCKYYKQEKLMTMSQSERDVLFLMVHTYNMRSIVLLEKIQHIIETKGYGVAKKTAQSFIAGFITYIGCKKCGVGSSSYMYSAVSMLWNQFGEILTEIPEIAIEVREHVYEYLKYKYFAELLELRLYVGVYPK